MDDDASLDDFVGAESADSDADASDDGPASSDGPQIDGAVPTSSWRPGGVCDRCGEPAPRRWQGGDDLVCAACKGWE